ncbi:hypothetical protein YTPLAS72_01990 [Nitrospira sp.]|nr:hypothetical protein YTPLAS72_01990 [Nitrospira sp.]
MEQWLKQGDMDRLGALLRKDPFRIAHPIIRAQLHYLTELSRCIERSDPVADLVTNEPVFPTGTRQNARTALLTMFQGMWNAFASGTLSVKQKKRRGHPHKWQDWEIKDFLENDYHPLMEHLEELEAETDANANSLRRNGRESRAAYLDRITKVVRQLDSLTGYSHKSGKTKSGEFTIRRGVIPLAIARMIARQAIPKDSVQKHILVTGLFAHYWGNDHTKWKRLHRIIERGEEMFPHLHRRKLRTNSF